MRVFIESGGCDRRLLDLTKIRRFLDLNGYELVNKPKRADCILVSTCAFNDYEENLSLDKVENYSNNGKRLIVYGCLPDISPEKFARFGNVEFIAPKDIENVEYLSREVKIPFNEMEDPNQIPGYLNFSSISGAARKFFREFKLSSSFLSKVKNFMISRSRNIVGRNTGEYLLFTSRGCVGDCSYCAIRKAIGPIQSKPLQSVIHELKRGLNYGHHKFTIIGDDVGAYGLDISKDFTSLLAAIQKTLNGGSGNNGRKDNISLALDEFHPKWAVRYEEQILQFLKNTPFVSRIRCPVQSGSERILSLMNRFHDTGKIRSTMIKMKEHRPEMKLATQIMIGFPTETENDFKKTLEFVYSAGFEEVTIFAYSDKSGVPSNAIAPKVSAKTIRNRIKMAQLYFKKKGIRNFLSCR